MRTDIEVQDRIRFLLSEELGRRFAVVDEKLPHKCQHNHRQPLDVRKEIDGDTNLDYNRVGPTPDEIKAGVDRLHLPVMGLCMLGSEDATQWTGNICEDPIDAQRCPYYSPTITRETLQAEFREQLQDLEWVRVNLPEVYGLLWALGSETLPKLPWWKAAWFWLLSIRPDGLTKDTPPQLPSGS